MPHSTSQSSGTLRQRIASGKYRLGQLGESLLEWIRRHRELTAGMLLVLAYLVLVRFLHQPVIVLPALVVAALGFYFFNRYPYVAFIGLVVVIHLFHYATVGSLGLTVSFLYGILIGGLILLQTSVQSEKYRDLLRGSFDIKGQLLVLFLFVGAITTVLSLKTDQVNYLDMYIYSHIQFIVIYYIVIVFINTEKRLYSTLLVVLIARALDGAYGLIQFIANPEIRVGGSFLDANEYACYSLLALPIALFLFRSTKSVIVRIGIVLASVFITIAVLVSSSRGAFIAMVALGIIILFIRSLELRTRILGFVIVILVFAALATSLYWDRIGTVEGVVEESERNHSLEVRISSLNDSFEFFLSSPLYGIGYGQFMFTSLDKYGGYSEENTRFAAHNSYTQVLAEHGLLGIIPYLLFIFLIIRDGYRAARDAKKAGDINLAQLVTGANLALITILIMGLTIRTYGKQMFFYFGLVAAAHRIVLNKLSSKKADDVVGKTLE